MREKFIVFDDDYWDFQDYFQFNTTGENWKTRENCWTKKWKKITFSHFQYVRKWKTTCHDWLNKRRGRKTVCSALKIATKSISGNNFIFTSRAMPDRVNWEFFLAIEKGRRHKKKAKSWNLFLNMNKKKKLFFLHFSMLACSPIDERSLCDSQIISNARCLWSYVVFFVHCSLFFCLLPL